MKPHYLSIEPSKLTMEHYAQAREKEDYPSAIAVWDFLASDIEKHLRENSGIPYNRNLPAIFSAFMPKSGGTYLYNRMINSLGYISYFWGISHSRDLSTVYPTVNACRNYRKGGYFSHTHAQPTPYFRMIMEREECGPIWVHIRHPAEACLAGFFHYQGKGQGKGEVAAQRVHHIEMEKDYLRKRHGFTFEDWPKFFRQSLFFYAEWVESWLDYEAEKPGRVLFTYFDELNDVQNLLRRVFQKYGDVPPLDGLITRQLPEDRRREEGSRNWREGLSAEDILSQARYLAVWDRALAARG